MKKVMGDFQNIDEMWNSKNVEEAILSELADTKLITK